MREYTKQFQRWNSTVGSSKCEATHGNASLERKQLWCDVPKVHEATVEFHPREVLAQHSESPHEIVSGVLWPPVAHSTTSTKAAPNFWGTL